MAQINTDENQDKKDPGIDESQVLNYLKATGMNRGLLLNFGRGHLDVKRFVF
jgi:GxxExxY protein